MKDKKNSIEFITTTNINRTFGWVQDSTKLNSLRRVVSIFNDKSPFYKEIIDDILPKYIFDENLLKYFIEELSKQKIALKYKDLVGSHSMPRKNSVCDGLIQAAVPGQSKAYISDWAADNFVRWAHALGFIDYDYESDRFMITELGLDYTNSIECSTQESEILEYAFLTYPPLCRILSLLSTGEHLTKFELGQNLGFLSENGFTSLPQNILIMNLALEKNGTVKNKMKSDWDGSSDKYARTIASWLINLGWVKKINKTVKVRVGNEEYSDIIPQAYVITDKGLKAYRRSRGINKVEQVPKTVFWEMLSTKGIDKKYIRTRRAYIIKFLAESSNILSIAEIKSKLDELGIVDNVVTISEDINGLCNIGLNIVSETRGFRLYDRIQKLKIPIMNIEESIKSNMLLLKEFCMDNLNLLPHKYLGLIDISYSPSMNRLFEMEVMELLIEQCGYSGLHLGGPNKPDGIIYTENLKDNYGVIVDTKAYGNGYNLPIGQSDEMKRYIDDNILRSSEITPNKWWKDFPLDIENFLFLFISSEFKGNIDEKLKNIYLKTNTKGAVLNVINLLMLAEDILNKSITLDKVYDLLSSNEEVKYNTINIGKY